MRIQQYSRNTRVVGQPLKRVQSVALIQTSDWNVAVLEFFFVPGKRNISQIEMDQDGDGKYMYFFS